MTMIMLLKDRRGDMKLILGSIVKEDEVVAVMLEIFPDILIVQENIRGGRKNPRGNMM